MNTQGGRQAIREGQFAWLESVMPIGFANMKAVPQISSILATIAGGVSIYYRKSYNIGGTSYLFCACTDGSAWQVLAASPYTVTQIAAAGTFSGTSTQIAQWKNERILIIDTVGGYRDWDGSMLTNNSGTSSAPSNGTLIATYAQRVWVVTGTSPSRTIAYSNVATYTDFGAPGGSTTITDETLTSSIEQLLVANNFLYFFGIDSINVIADVQVVAGATTFSNTNLVANSGSDLPATAIPYYRSIWYMNNAGIFALYGATPRKASDDLDGVFQNIDFTKPITGGTVVIYNQFCVCFCFTYNDPLLGARQLMAIYFNKKWFVASQSTDVTGIATVHGSADMMYGTEGANVYQLFQDTSSDITQTIISRLWDFDDYISIKESIRLGVEMTLPQGTGSISATMDTERYQQAPSVPLGGSFAFTWTNSLGATFTWTNSLSATFTWLVSGYIWFQGDVEVQGHYLGFSLSSSVAQNIYQGMQIQHRKLPAGWGT